MVNSITTQHTTARYQPRLRPYTVTRGLPHDVIGKDSQRFQRLVRAYDHRWCWRGGTSQPMIERQCERLHARVSREVCSYSGR